MKVIKEIPYLNQSLAHVSVTPSMQMQACVFCGDKPARLIIEMMLHTSRHLRTDQSGRKMTAWDPLNLRFSGDTPHVYIALERGAPLPLQLFSLLFKLKGYASSSNPWPLPGWHGSNKTDENG